MRREHLKTIKGANPESLTIINNDRNSKQILYISSLGYKNAYPRSSVTEQTHKHEQKSNRGEIRHATGTLN